MNDNMNSMLSFVSDCRKTKATDIQSIAFHDVVRRIKDGTHGLADLTTTCREQKDSKTYSVYKVKNLPAVTFGSELKSREKSIPLEQRLSSYSGLVCLDFDDVDVGYVLSEVSQFPSTRLAFISPSGQGVKVVVSVSPMPQNDIEYKAAFAAVVEQYEHIGDIDRSGSDVTRLCFLCHDTNAHFKETEILPIKWQLFDYDHKEDTSKDFEMWEVIDLSVLEFISADDYDIWLRVGMACHHHGLDLSIWDSWSKKSDKYEVGTCAKKWNTFDNSKQKPITWGWVVYTARCYGYKPTMRKSTRHCSDPLPTPIPVETTEKIDIAFPMDAFHGYFYDYLMAFEGKNEVCPAFHFAGLLSVVGATLGRSVWIQGARPTYPIFYQALIGNTTIARKSTALGFATELLRRVDSDVVMIDNVSSAEGLIDVFDTDSEHNHIDVSDFEGVRGFIHYDELKNLFLKAKQKATENITSKLTEMYNGVHSLSNNTRVNRTIAKYPTTSLLGCSTFAWLESGLSIDDITGGFANRFVFYLHEQQELIPNALEPDEHKLKSVQDRIIAVREKWQGKHQKFTFTEQAQYAHDKIYIETNKRLINEENDLVAAAKQRTLDYAKKLALVFAVLDEKNEDTTIGIEHWESAVLVKNYWEAVATDLFSRLVISDDAKNELLFLEKLAELGNNTTTRALQRKIGNMRMSSSDFKKILDTHIATGVVELYRKDGERKRYVCRVED